MAEPVRDYVVTPHAESVMRRRGISEEIVKAILNAPEQRVEVRQGRDVLQSKVPMSGKTYLVRVFVDVDRRPAEVVTVYRTSRISRYWRDRS